MKNRYTLINDITGETIDDFDTLSQAVSHLVAHEVADKNDGTYSYGFYAIYDNLKEENIDIVDHHYKFNKTNQPRGNKKMIIKKIGLYEFREAFSYCDRKDNFSYAGLEVLFDHLEEVSDCCNINIELDVIALCCEYTESTISDALAWYDLASLEELQDRTHVLNVDSDTIIYQNY